MRTLFGELPDPEPTRRRTPRPTSGRATAQDPPAQRHSATSVAAAAEAAPRVLSWQAITENAIRAAGRDGLTDEEGIDATGMPPSTYRPRRIKMVELGRVRDSGRTRPTRSGKPAVVWVHSDNLGAAVQ